MRLILLAILFSSLAFAGTQFDTGSDVPSKELIQDVDALYQSKVKNKNVSLVIEGHTDIRGGAQYNLKLSKRRAQSIANRFIELGVNKDKISIVGLGSTQPISSDHGVNRRIVVIVKDVNNGMTDTTILSEKKQESVQQIKEVIKYRYIVEKQEAHENILSLKAVSSFYGLKSTYYTNEAYVEENRRIGVGLQYQRRFDNLYIGAGLDTNGGGDVSIGFGF